MIQPSCKQARLGLDAHLVKRTNRTKAVFFRPEHSLPMGGLCGAISKGIAPVTLATGRPTRTVSPTRLDAGAKFKTLAKEREDLAKNRDKKTLDTLNQKY